MNRLRNRDMVEGGGASSVSSVGRMSNPFDVVGENTEPEGD